MDVVDLSRRGVASSTARSRVARFSARAASTKFVFESNVVTFWSTVMVRSKSLL